MNISVRDDLKEENRKVLVALAIAIFIHLLIILSAAAWVTFHATTPAPPKEDKPIELTIMDRPVPQAKHDPDYITTTESQRSDKAPANPVFQSDKDTQAASALAASGTAPLPTQEGEEHRGVEFENREYTAGREARPASPAGAPPQPTKSTSQPTPAPAATPSNTPEEVPTPRATSQLALLEPPKAREMPQTTPPPQPVNPSQQPPQPTQAQPSTPSAPGYQPQTRITRIRGDISNRGRSSVAAAATPLGRYKKQVLDAIGSRWYYYVSEHSDLFSPGTVVIRWVIQNNGKVTNVRIQSNSSTESFASCTESAIMEAEIPPIPKELLPMLDGGQLEIEEGFTIL